MEDAKASGRFTNVNTYELVCKNKVVQRLSLNGERYEDPK